MMCDNNLLQENNHPPLATSNTHPGRPDRQTLVLVITTGKHRIEIEIAGNLDGEGARC